MKYLTALISCVCVVASFSEALLNDSPYARYAILAAAVSTSSSYTGVFNELYIDIISIYKYHITRVKLLIYKPETCQYIMHGSAAVECRRYQRCLG
jgi:hypothetical protein